MSSQLNNSILRLLECPVCMNYMSKRILSCVRGHSICISCGRQVHVCPTCKRPISLTHRNYSLESIGELLEYPCNYIGCKEYYKPNEVKDHRSRCSYRPYRCLLGSVLTPCQWQGSRFDLAAHALIHHSNKISIVQSEKYKWNFSDPLHEVNMIAFYDELFLLHRKLVKDQNRNETMYWAVQYVGKSEDNIQFYYKVNISCEEYEHRSITIVERCCDDLRSIDEIMAEDFCVAVPMQQLETYQDKNKEISYEVFIYKL